MSSQHSCPLPSPDFSKVPTARRSDRPDPSAGQKVASRRRPQCDEKTAKEAFDHCVALTRKRDFANYVAALLMPTLARPAVFALLAFNVELAVIRDQIRRNEGTAGIYRLQFWKDAINCIYGHDEGPVPKQPVALALRCFAGCASADSLMELISSRQSTLGDRPFVSLETVEEYGRRCHGSLIKLTMHALAEARSRELRRAGKNPSLHVDAAAVDAAEAMGAAMSVATLLRSTVPMLSRGVVLLPADLLSIHGLTADSVYSNKKPDAVRAVTVDMAKEATRLLEAARSKREAVLCTFRPALMANGATVDDVLRTLKKKDFNLFHARLQRGFSLLAWTLWWRKTVGRY